MTRTVYENLGAYNVGESGDVRSGAVSATGPLLDAMNSAQNAPYGGTVVELPPGRFELGSVPRGHAAILMQNRENVIIRGQQPGLTTITFDADNVEGRMFGLVDCTNVEFQNIGFDGRCTTGTKVDFNTPIDMRGCVKVKIQDCWFDNTGNSAIRAAHKGLNAASDQIPDGTRASSEVQIINNRFQLCYGSGGILTKAGGAERIRISGNQFYDMGIQAISYEAEDPGVTNSPLIGSKAIISDNIIDGVNGLLRSNQNQSAGITLQENVFNTVVSGNVISNVDGNFTSRGIWLTTSPSQSDRPIRNVVVANNVIDTVIQQAGGGQAIALHSGLETIQNVVVQGNQTTGSRYGIGFDTGDYQNLGVGGEYSMRGVNITGNNITAEELCVYTIAQRNSANANFSRPIDLINITGNHLQAAETNNGRWRGIQAFANRGNIVGNTCWGRNIGNSVGIELYDDQSSTDLYVDVEKYVNANAVFECGQDVALTGASVAQLQQGKGYTLVEGAGRHRTSAGIFSAETDGTVTGTQT